MESTSGTVRSFSTHRDGRRAIVDVEVSAVCARCAAGTGCGAGVLGGSGRMRRIEARIAPGLDLREGDSVRVTLRPRDLLHAAAAAYGPPLLGAAAATAVAHGAAAGDAATAVAALFGMLLGVAVSRLYLHRTACLRRFVPLVDRLSPAHLREV